MAEATVCSLFANFSYLKLHRSCICTLYALYFDVVIIWRYAERLFGSSLYLIHVRLFSAYVSV